MKLENRKLRNMWTAVVIIMGNVLYALTVKLFLLPGNLMVGGTTGIALMVRRFTGMSLGNAGGRLSYARKEICAYYDY